MTQMTGVTFLRDDVAKTRSEEMAWYEKFNAHEEVTDETCVSRTGRKPICCRWPDINKGDNERAEVRSRMVAREIKTERDRKTTVSTRTLRDKAEPRRSQRRVSDNNSWCWTPNEHSYTLTRRARRT